MSNGFIAQLLPLTVWFEAVNRVVTEPYLDEVFHVRQAQNYLKNRFDIWDDKITTPPGLYLLSYAISPVAGDTLKALRALSLFCLATISPVVYSTYVRRQKGRHDPSATHSALNISLLPPLFFFSALYYTDIASTLSVVLFYRHFLKCAQPIGDWWDYPLLVLLGLFSLVFRQTNIFWVAIFPAGLVLVDMLDQGHDVVKKSMFRRAEGFGDGMVSIAKTSWKMNVVFDPSVRDAWFEDYFSTVISIVACLCKAILDPRRIIPLILALSPYLAILWAFAAFVIWNGGVVLGDKSNHIATINLPQMLYIWPYFVFFSWPMVYPYFAALAFDAIAKLSQFSPLDAMLIFKRRRLVPRFWLTLAIFAVSCLIVRFNTTIHPFLLADNRHYMFYVFKRLMRPWWMKYAAIPVYVYSAWACVQALGVRPYAVTRQETTKETTDGATQPSATNDLTRTTDSSIPTPDGKNSAKTTFVLVWLATTTMQLVTAPLVDVRYLILPWIFWRMHIPLQRYRPAESPKASSAPPSSKPVPSESASSAPPTASSPPNPAAKVTELDHRLWLETAWFLLINAVTGYVFLKFGFEWPQEPGAIQRFMW